MPKTAFIVMVRDAGRIIYKKIFNSRKKADKLVGKLKLKGLDVLFF